MVNYPESVLTRNKKGELEVRNLLSKGRFVKYNYLNPETGEVVEKGKMSIILRDDKGQEEHYFLIPLKDGRYLALESKDEKKDRKFWDGKKAVDF